MPTTLFAHDPALPPFYSKDDSLHHSNFYPARSLYIISEHEYVQSLIPSVARREARVQSLKSPLTRLQTISITTTPLRPLRPKKTPHPLMATMTMATIGLGIEGAPSSPPDLTNSKSSKSSSYHSETLSDIAGPNDLSHFEDINLDDAQGAFAPSSFPMPVSPSDRVLFEASRTSMSSMRSQSTPHAPGLSFRDLTGASKPRYPSLKGQINGAVRAQHQAGLNAPTRSSMRRGLSSPSAPSLTNDLSAGGRKSRSPSPANSQVFSSAPRSLSRRNSRNLDVSPMQGNRRQSWQYGNGNRKTVKEREAEVNDSDDELPEDAVIWNVPMSPRPPHDRSPTPSASHSPPTASPAGSRPASLRSASGQTPSLERTVSSASASTSLKDSAPQSPNPTYPNEAQPASGQLSRQRTNTWDETYTTLDPDAKLLTEALEQFQLEHEQQQEIERQKSKARPVSEQPTSRAKTKSLPPLRRSDPLIDPFQPSKEKEKYLSRTRPSWLPPKNPKEEKKHLKELQAIEARRLAAERAEAAKADEQRRAREQAEIVKTDLWKHYLLPQWDIEVRGKEGRSKNRKVWWQGVPSVMRGEVWTRAIGNDLGVTEETFNKALKHAMSDEPAREAEMHQVEAVQAFVQRESKKVFPETGLFGPGQVFHGDLVKLYLAYKEYRPDLPEDMLDGVLHISALLLINMPLTSAFICLANLLNRPTPLIFLLNQTSAMAPAFDISLRTLRLKAPTLTNHLENVLHLSPTEYLPLLFRSLVCDRLPLEHAARLMDLYSIEGDKILTRAAVALLLALESRLYVETKEQILEVLEGRRGKERGGAAGPGLPGVDEWVNWVVEAGKM